MFTFLKRMSLKDKKSESLISNPAESNLSAHLLPDKGDIFRELSLDLFPEKQMQEPKNVPSKSVGANSKIEEYPEVFVQITSCISSASEYKQDSYAIFEALAQRSKVYTDNFLLTLTKVFLSSEYSPTSKFYALRLLAKATEQKNEFLLTRLAHQQPLLDKLFQDSQIDRAKSIEDRGRQFFSKTPTDEESMVGNHFIRLILEAIVFWRQNYGSEDKANPLRIYNAMHAALAPRVKLPEKYIFFTKTDDILASFHPQGLEASSKLEVQTNLNIKKEENKQEAAYKTNCNIHQIENENDTEVSTHVALCISSSKNYKLNSHLVFDGLAQKSKVYTDSFLKEASVS